ncbi:tyrosine-type recombinase/integrase [Parabacteroides merdae]|uniref:tyrosine-type recombinase/integrase n=1 Tax=Parabacteroides merdae TaxID=46503 RepID=UPI003F952E6F
MSAKNSYTTADFIEWNTAINLVHRLYKDKNYKMSLLIGCGIFFGLRISDILQLSWNMLLDDSSFELIEKKTQKRREIRINKGFQKHIRDCYNALLITDKSEKCFKSREHRVYSIQRINMLLKDIKKKYSIKSVKNFSTHSLRKTFGRHVYERADANGEMALVMLSELFNHSNIAITKRYLGLRKEEILGCYDLLDF